MENNEINGALDFLRAAEQLKNTFRSAHTSIGRQESAAEHTWRLNDLVFGRSSLIASLAQDTQQEILSLWDDYETAESSEAKLAKAFDKLETLLQHTQGKNPSDFDYGFNLKYGQRYTSYDSLTSRLRAIIDQDTQRLALENGTLPK